VNLAPHTLDGEWFDEVLGFWFHELTPAHWFKRDDAVDAAIDRRFRLLHASVAAANVEILAGHANAALAGVIALDQFPRNMFRGTPRAFATDARALALAEAALDAGFDRDMGLHQRLFLYLPFEHSEALADQERAVALIAALGDAEYTRYAIAHRDVIARFGRFPHRNGILGRISPPEEITYLAQPGNGF
jgi:uncharacterized protein (DUF924 family)